MPFCTQCGKEISAEAKFCSSCGSRRNSNNLQAAPLKKETQVGKKGGFPLIPVIFGLFVVYVILDVWAISQLEVDTSIDSIISSVSNFDLQTGPLSSSASTSVRIRNPTVIPVIAGQISFDASYGDTKIADGSTDLIVIMPNSYSDTPAHVKLSYVNAGKAALEGLIDVITQNTKTPKLSIYAGFGPIKIPVKEIK